MGGSNLRKLQEDSELHLMPDEDFDMILITSGTPCKLMPWNFPNTFHNFEQLTSINNASLPPTATCPLQVLALGRYQTVLLQS